MPSLLSIDSNYFYLSLDVMTLVLAGRYTGRIRVPNMDRYGEVLVIWAIGYNVNGT
jgi:hypothetical protein